MATRRELLRGGLGALALGVLGRRGFGGCVFPDAIPLPRIGGTSPFLPVTPGAHVIKLGGLPFYSWYTGDDYKNESIPFHYVSAITPPEPEESVDVAVVGGGLGGLVSAWLLREFQPVVFEFRERFGGNAMGEVWDGIPFSLGSAYLISPDAGSFLDGLYTELGLDRVRRESFPPDPAVVGGRINRDFWSGVGLPTEEEAAMQSYAGVVRSMTGDSYPEIPLPGDPAGDRWVVELDQKTFREDLEQRMGRPLTPFLAAGVQSYFYSSFCAGIDEISAASGWNFVAAEEYGRWVFPGGNAYVAWALWDRLRQLPAGERGSCLRARCRVVDVRLAEKGVQVSYLDPTGELRSLIARQVVLAGSKHICKNILHDLANLDPEKLDAMHAIDTGAYLVANLLLETAVELEDYDVFLIRDENFPMDPASMYDRRPVIDVLRGDYAQAGGQRSVLTLYWPLPFPGSRFVLIATGSWLDLVRGLIPQVKEILNLVNVPPSLVREIRITRWGHAMPIARHGLIADGTAERAHRPIEGRIHFVNQDNWALPAVENTLLDAQATAEVIRATLRR